MQPDTILTKTIKCFISLKRRYSSSIEYDDSKDDSDSDLVSK